MTDITRINRIQSYKVLGEFRALDIVLMFDMDDTHQNNYFVVSTQVSHLEPRLLRDYREYLKWELKDTPILVLQLQTTETKTIMKPKEVKLPKSDSERNIIKDE